ITFSPTLTPTGSGWQEVSGTDVVPEGAVTATWEILVPTASTGGYMYMARPVWRKSVTPEVLVDGAVPARAIAANAVESNKIAANAITADKIDAGAITTVKLAALAITSEKIAA